VSSGNDNPNDCSGCHKHDSAFQPSGCSGCHGGTAGVDADGYWPDGVGGNPEDDAGRHVEHMTVLARRVYNEDLTGLMTNSAATSDEKQKKLCAFCHPDAFTAAFDPGTSESWNDVHNKGTTEAGGIYGHRLWDAYGAPFGSTDGWAYTADVSAFDGSCASVDCHNNKTTDITTDNGATGFGWYDTDSSTCTMCHTAGGGVAGEIANPVDGLHRNASSPTPDTPSISGESHDDAFAGGSGSCSTCHSNGFPDLAATQASTHVDGTAKTDDGTNVAGDFWLFTAYSDGAGDAGSCSGASVGDAAGCHSAYAVTNGDDGSWARLWSSTAYSTDGSECDNCHGGLNGGASSDWTFGQAANDTDGEVGTGDSHGSYTEGGSFWNPVDATSFHGNGSIDMNGPTPVTGTGYNDVDWGCDNASACHGDASTGHHLENSAWAVATTDFGTATCSSCHGYPPLQTSDPNATQYDDDSEREYLYGGGAHGKNGHVPFGSTADQTWAKCNPCHADEETEHTKNLSQLNATTWTEVTVTIKADYDLSTGAVYDGTIGIDDPSVTKTCDNVSCHYGLTPDWAMRDLIVGDTISVTNGADNPAGTAYVPAAGQADVVMQQFSMTASSLTDDVTQVVVTKTGSAVVSASGAHLYRDINSNGVLDGDTEIGGTGTSFVGNDATFTVSETIGVGGTDYLVVFDIDSSSADGSQITSQVTSITPLVYTPTYSNSSRTASMDKTLPDSAITTSGYITTADPVTIDGGHGHHRLVLHLQSRHRGAAEHRVPGDRRRRERGDEFRHRHGDPGPCCAHSEQRGGGGRHPRGRDVLGGGEQRRGDNLR
jgi:hypothetical protein